MVTCTRALCYGPSTCNCADSAPRKRKRLFSSAGGRSRKALKTSEDCARRRHELYHQPGNISQDIQAYDTALSRQDSDEYSSAGPLEDQSLPTSTKSKPASPKNKCSLCLYTRTPLCLHTGSRGLPSPISCDDYQTPRGDELRSCYGRKMDKRERLGNCTKRLRTDFNIVAHPDKVIGRNEPLSANPRSEDERVSIGCPYSVALGPSITPPKSLSTPPEYVHEVTFNPEFVEDFIRAYKASRYVDALRAHKYGEDVAVEYRRGFTPEDIREEWQRVADQQRADANTLSDSEG